MIRFSLFVRTDLIELNGNQCLAYYIVAQDSNGRRLRLNTSLINSTEMCDRTARDTQNRRILKIESALAGGLPLNPNHWTEITPATGSPAYQVAKQAGLIN